MCVARLTVQRYGIYGAGANFPAQKQGCFSKHTQFFLWPVFWARNSGTVEQITVEQKLKCRTTSEQEKLPEQRNREQITVEQKLKCRKNPLRILYNI